MIDFDQLCRETLYLLRGDRTQMELSQELGYKGNIIYKFESGHKHLKLGHFIKVCEICRVDLRSRFRTKLDLDFNEMSATNIQKAFFKTWALSSEDHIQELLSTSRTRLWKLRTGKAELTLHEFFKLIDYFTDRLYIFLNNIVDTKEYSKSALPDHKRFNSYELYIHYPEVLYLTSLCFLKEVNETPNILKKEKLFSLSKLSRQRFEQIYEHITKSGHLMLKGDCYETNSYKLDIRSQNSSVTFKIKKKVWELLDYFSKSWIKEDTIFKKRTLRVAPVSQVAKEQIIQIYKQAYLDVSKVVDADKDSCEKEDLIYYRQELFFHSDLSQEDLK